MTAQTNNGLDDTTDTESKIMSDEQDRQLSMPEGDFKRGVERLEKAIENGFEQLNETLRTDYVSYKMLNKTLETRDERFNNLKERVDELIKARNTVIGIIITAVIIALLSLVIIK